MRIGYVLIAALAFMLLAAGGTLSQGETGHGVSPFSMAGGRDDCGWMKMELPEPPEGYGWNGLVMDHQGDLWMCAGPIARFSIREFRWEEMTSTPVYGPVPALSPDGTVWWPGDPLFDPYIYHYSDGNVSREWPSSYAGTWQCQLSIDVNGWPHCTTSLGYGDDPGTYILWREADRWQFLRELCGVRLSKLPDGGGIAITGWDEAVMLVGKNSGDDSTSIGLEYAPGLCLDIPEEFSEDCFLRFFPDDGLLFLSSLGFPAGACELLWGRRVDDTIETVRRLDIRRVVSFPHSYTQSSLSGNRWEMDADGAIWIVSYQADDGPGLYRIKDEVERIPFPNEGVRPISGAAVCIDRNGNKVMVTSGGFPVVYPKQIATYSDGGPASQRLELFAYLDGDSEQELVVEAEVVNYALAAAWLNAYFMAECDGQLYYAPRWSLTGSRRAPGRGRLATSSGLPSISSRRATTSSTAESPSGTARWTNSSARHPRRSPSPSLIFREKG